LRACLVKGEADRVPMTYVLAELHGGPLHGQVVQVPASASGWPVRDVGFPAFVLDEATERCWWDTANYFLPGPHPPRRGERWWFAYSRTLPGFPSYSRDHPVG
jgi:hypothetical protein